MREVTRARRLRHERRRKAWHRRMERWTREIGSRRMQFTRRGDPLGHVNTWPKGPGSVWSRVTKKWSRPGKYGRVTPWTMATPTPWLFPPCAPRGTRPHA